jgi:sialate O-acetylesterase
MPPDFPSLDTWILAGQSNMQGVGLLSEALSPDDRVWAFSMAGKWEPAQDPLHPLWLSCQPVHQELRRPNLPPEQQGLSNEELHKLSTAVCGAGLGLSFGKAMADALGTPVGLLPAAHGGTSLDQWSPSLKEHGGHSLYGAMLQSVKAAGAPLRGLLWYQGESDALADQGQTYGERLAAWITALREDLGLPDLPVLLVQLGNFVSTDRGTEHAWDLVREALAELPMQVPFTAVTTAADLPLNDIIHVDAGGLIRLGRRLARQALHLAGHAEYASGPVLQSLEPATWPNGLATVRVHCSGLTGAWHPEKIFGFSTWTGAGEPHPSLSVVSASPDPNDPAVIRVLLTLTPGDPALAEARLGYGLGLDPCCNAVDDADMPLCSFLPRPLDWKR